MLLLCPPTAAAEAVAVATMVVGHMCADGETSWPMPDDCGLWNCRLALVP